MPKTHSRNRVVQQLNFCVTLALEPGGWEVKVERGQCVGRSSLSRSISSSRSGACHLVGGVIVGETCWLHQLEGNLRKVAQEFADDEGCDDQGDEDDEHDKVKNGEADDPPLPQSRLLQRIDWWPNLTAISQG